MTNSLYYTLKDCGRNVCTQSYKNTLGLVNRHYIGRADNLHNTIEDYKKRYEEEINEKIDNLLNWADMYKAYRW